MSNDLKWGGRISSGRIVGVGLLAVVAAAVANAVVDIVAVAVFGISPAFRALQLGPVVSFTVIGVLGAVAVFALVARFSRRPVWVYRRIALVALASPFPGASVIAVATLMVMHVVAWAISVGMLSRLIPDLHSEGT